MSGIYGIWRLDGAPPEGLWLRRMAAALCDRGPAQQIKVSGSMGMGFRQMQADQSFSAGRWMTVAAARLDNPEELATELGWHEWTDAELVQAAWERWGPALGSHLEGSWTIAAGDGVSLTLLRDATGNSTLYYTQTPSYVAFASNINALLTLPDLDARIDTEAIAGVLTGWTEQPERTAYAGIEQLLWAEGLRFGAEGQRQRWRWWQAEAFAATAEVADRDAEDALLDALERAIRGAIGSSQRVAAVLNGGRDCGAVATLAAPLLAVENRRLTAYTTTTGGQRGGPWQAAHALARQAGPNIDHLSVDAGGCSLVCGLERVLDVHNGPTYAAASHGRMQALVRQAAEDGVQTLLVGQLGRATICWSGRGMALAALAAGNLRQALRLFAEAEPTFGATLRRQLLWPLLSPMLRPLRRLSGLGWRGRSALSVEMGRRLRISEKMLAAGWDETATVSWRDDLRLSALSRVGAVQAGLWSELGAQSGISIVDPTANLRLVELLLRMPDAQFYRCGPASLFRRSFGGRLPWTGEREIGGLEIARRILLEENEIDDTLRELARLPAAREMLALDRMRVVFEAVLVHPTPAHILDAQRILLRGLGVGIFLLRQENRGWSVPEPGRSVRWLATHGA